jgi:cytosine/creatinine deaminase
LLNGPPTEDAMTKHRDVTIPETGAYTLRRARVPAPFLVDAPPALARDAEGCALVDLSIANGNIASIAAPIAGPGIDLEGRLVWATLIDVHTHLDKGQVIPRALPDGTLDGGMIGTFEDRKKWTHADIKARMEFGLRCAYAHGVGAIRTHLDSQEENARVSWAVFRELRAEWKGRVELQAVGLVPLTFFRNAWGAELADLVAESGGVLGGTTDAIGHYDGAKNEELVALIDRFLEIAGERGLDVDMHVDQSDDPAAFSLPLIADSVLRTGFKGKILAGHCVNLALQDAGTIARTAEACAKAGIAVATMPTPMVYLQDRKRGRTPRWRGVTAAHELMAAGVKVAIGGDNCRDAWFPYGDHDMVDTLQQTVRVLQLDDDLAQAAAMAGPISAEIAGLNNAGRIAIGQPANLVLFAARTLNEFMCRPQSDRIVLNAGKRVRDPLPDYAELDAALGVSMSS